MEHYSIVIFIMVLMIGISAIAEKISIPYPVLLIITGIAIGFTPSMPEISINPEIIMLIFLPPLLYDAAFNISFNSFRDQFSTISALAFGLVFLTTSGIAVFSYYCIPGMTWPVAFVLGSILSATDAVAAISITKGIGLSHRAVTILEGESLINDASALVAYRFAVAAVSGSAFIFWEAGIDFLILIFGGILIGGILGVILGWVLHLVRSNSPVVISLMLIMPFATYLVAEEFGVSGVIAVVVLGLSMSRLSRKRFPEALRNQSKSFWDILIFLLNGLIFILIGLQFPYVLKEMDADQILPNIGYAFIITIIALALRTARVFLQKRNLLRGKQSGKVRIKDEMLLDFYDSIIISWSGMRGIISLAIAIGIPATLADGSTFPHRHTIIFISVVVVLITLVGQGLTLPWIAVKLKNIQRTNNL